MKNLIFTAILMFYVSQVSAQYYGTYPAPNYHPAVNYNSQGVPQYVPTIENNGPQVYMRREAERANRQNEYIDAIIEYEMIYKDTYRR